MGAVNIFRKTFIPLDLVTEKRTDEKVFFGESHIRSYRNSVLHNMYSCIDPALITKITWELSKVDEPLDINKDKIDWLSSTLTTLKSLMPGKLQNRPRENIELQPVTITTFESIKEDDFYVRKDEKIDLSYSRSKLQWEGCVTKVNKDTFTARLYNDTGEEFTAKFPIEDVSEDDKALVQENNIFYWSIGYRTTQSNQRINEEILIFRRLPAWRKFDINKPSDKAKKRIEFFNRPKDQDSSQAKSN